MTAKKTGDAAGQRQLILRLLPKLLEEDIGFRARIAGLLADNLTTREETHKLFEEIKLLREETAKRFEAVDRRFEALIAEMKGMKIELKEIRVDMKDQRDWMETIVGGFQRRAGRSLEDMAAGALRYALGMKHIAPEAIRLRQKLTDSNGVIGPKGRTYEYDIIASDGETYLFEVKSQADEEAVLRFNDKAELAMKELGLKDAKKVILTLDKSPEVKETCNRCGIMLP